MLTCLRDASGVPFLKGSRGEGVGILATSLRKNSSVFHCVVWFIPRFDGLMTVWRLVLPSAFSDKIASPPEKAQNVRQHHHSRCSVAQHPSPCVCSRRSRTPTMGDDAHYCDDNSSDDSEFEHIDICPLESQCNPSLDGVFDKDAVLARVANLTPPELASLSELCMCFKPCKYRKCVDSDTAWWPHCAAAWYEPGSAPEKMGKPPKQRKTWKNAYLALRPEEGPTPEEVAAREAKIKQREEKLAQWQLENKVGKLSVKGTGRNGETIVSPLGGKDDKNSMRDFYKNVRSKPKGKTSKGGVATHAEED